MMSSSLIATTLCRTGTRSLPRRHRAGLTAGSRVGYGHVMTADLRAALSTPRRRPRTSPRGGDDAARPDDPSVVAAATDLADAFDDYDELLFETTEVATPLAVFEGDDDDDDSDDDDDDSDDDDDDDDDDDEDDDEDWTSSTRRASDHHFGLDDEEYDVDDAEDAPVRPASSWTSSRAVTIWAGSRTSSASRASFSWAVVRAHQR